ncbi:predicted protein [Arabidopsis lyrata subsp. lyrata]|uniref:Predicted protein n=1 Tax=Arabidopsis lyrata subsp. lyrata TaxID=81972 RepID=D7MXX6_ARALL|nr:predicted protein [Arabidopsis lyrata subsp. lyrata]
MSMLKGLMWLESKVGKVSDLALALTILFFYLHVAGPSKLLLFKRDLRFSDGLLSIILTVFSKALGPNLWGRELGSIFCTEVVATYKKLMWGECCSSCLVVRQWMVRRHVPDGEAPLTGEETIKSL